MRLLLLLLLISGCGTIEAQHRTTPNYLLMQTEQPLAGYLLDFLRDCAHADFRWLNNLQWIKYVEDDEVLMGSKRVVGVCTTQDQHTYIKVKRLNSPLREKALLYHELAHCLFRVGHSRGIMSAELPSAYWLSQNWDEAVAEMCALGVRE
jgi:hypothetical protein